MSKPLKQFAALPVAMIDGQPHVLLITSRETHRWIIPKGHAERHLSPSTLAHLEALEEAGVSGEIEAEPIGRYRSAKRLSSGRMRECEVTVFRLDVQTHLDEWKEKRQRERRWVPLAEAPSLATDGGLSAFLTDLRLVRDPPDLPAREMAVGSSAA